MSNLVDRDGLRRKNSTGREEEGSSGDQHGIFHPPAVALESRVHDGQSLIGVRSKPFPVIAQGVKCSREIAVRKSLMLGLEQELNLDFWKLVVLKVPLKLDEARTGCPGKIVNVLGNKPVFHLTTEFSLTAQISGSPDQIGRRNPEPYIVHSKIGVVLGVSMVLVAVPALLLQNSHLRKPLRHKEIILDPASPCDSSGQLRPELQIQCDLFSAFHRVLEVHSQDRFIVLVAVVRLDEIVTENSIPAGTGLLADAKGSDGHRAPVRLGDFTAGIPVELELALPGKRTELILKGIQVKVQKKVICRVAGDISPPDLFTAGDCPGQRVQSDFDCVTCDQAVRTQPVVSLRLAADGGAQSKQSRTGRQKEPSPPPPSTHFHHGLLVGTGVPGPKVLKAFNQSLLNEQVIQDLQNILGSGGHVIHFKQDLLVVVADVHGRTDRIDERAKIQIAQYFRVSAHGHDSGQLSERTDQSGGQVGSLYRPGQWFRKNANSCDSIGPLAQEFNQSVAAGSPEQNVILAIFELLVLGNLTHASNSKDVFSVPLPPGPFEKGHANLATFVQDLGDHLPVALFEDVERQQSVWEQDNIGKWEDGYLNNVETRSHFPSHGLEAT